MQEREARLTRQKQYKRASSAAMLRQQNRGAIAPLLSQLQYSSLVVAKLKGSTPTQRKFPPPMLISM